MKRIPALIVSGFLGSGKTTLVRRLLQAAQREGARVAFISNELGELGIDQALLGGGAEATVELAGGCVCCALNDELYDTLIALHERVNPDRVVIETSGVAVPHDVQITLYQPPIRDWISEEAIVVVVNAEQVKLGVELEGTFTEQIESADLVLLNKTDLIEADDAPGLMRRLALMNPGVPVLPCERSDVDPRLLLAASAGPRTQPPAPHEDHEHHHQDYESFEIRVPDGLDLEAIEERVRPLGALRVKGFVRTEDGPAALQGVGRRLELQTLEDPVDEALFGRVVIIRRRA